MISMALMWVGCEKPPERHYRSKGDYKMENTNVEHNSVSLEAKISRSDKGLSLDYRINNGSEKAIYVFNVLWEFGSDGKQSPAPNALYTALSDDGTLHFLKGIPAVPKGKRVELKIVPFVTKIEAGAEFHEQFELSEPISEYNPYFPTLGTDNEELTSSENVIFSIQFIRDLEGMEEKPAPINGAYSIWHPDMFGRIETLSSPIRPMMIKINRRTDEFERF